MTIETWNDLPKATNKELIQFLRKQIHIILVKAQSNYKIVVVALDDILKEIEKRLEVK